MKTLQMNPNFVGVIKTNPEKTTPGGLILTGAMDNDLCRCRVIYNSSPDDCKYALDSEVLISPKNMIRTKVTGEEFFVVKIEDVWGIFKE